MNKNIKIKTTDIEHSRHISDCHTAWSRILSVVFKLYPIPHGCQYNATTEQNEIEQSVSQFVETQANNRGYLEDLSMGGYE